MPSLLKSLDFFARSWCSSSNNYWVEDPQKLNNLLDKNIGVVTANDELRLKEIDTFEGSIVSFIFQKLNNGILTQETIETRYIHDGLVNAFLNAKHGTLTIQQQNRLGLRDTKHTRKLTA